MRSLILLALCSCSYGVKQFQLPSFSYVDLFESRDSILRSLQNDGIIVIDSIPGYAQSRREVLLSLHQCKDGTATIMDDGSSRSTIGGEVKQG